LIVVFTCSVITGRRAELTSIKKREIINRVEELILPGKNPSRTNIPIRKPNDKSKQVNQQQNGQL
jgi:hypothetical protein